MNKLRKRLEKLSVEYEKNNIPRDRYGNKLTEKDDPSIEYWSKRDKQVEDQQKSMSQVAYEPIYTKDK